MSSLDIRINIKELTDYSGEPRKSKYKRTLLLMIQAFSQYVVDLYLELIEEAINSRTYKGNWEPLDDEGYLEYLGVTPSVNILELIRDSLEVKKIGNNFVVRIDPSYKYPKTKLPLIKVLRAIEKGTSKFNARPLMSKVARDIKYNIRDLWRGYLAMKGVLGV